MLVIRSGRHPHEVYLLAVFALAGIAGLLAPERTSNSVLKSMPATGIYLFYAVLTVGSLVAIAGVFTPGLKGPVIELYGLAILTAELVVYGAAILGIADGRGLLSALIPIGFGIANIVRIRGIRTELKAARAGAVATNTVRQLEGP